MVSKLGRRQSEAESNTVRCRYDAVNFPPHYIDVIMTTMASQITSLTVVYSTVYSDADQTKHQSSGSLAFVWGIHRDRWMPRTKGQLRGKCFHLMTSSWNPHKIVTPHSSPETLWFTLPAKSLEYFEAQWKHSYLTFWFAGNGLAKTTTKYCHSNAFLMRGVRSEKYNLQCPKLKLHKIIYGDLSFSILCIKFPTTSRVYVITLWICGNVMCAQWLVNSIAQNLGPIAG